MEAYPNLKPWRPGQSGNLNLPCPVPIGRAHCRGRFTILDQNDLFRNEADDPALR